MHDYVTDPCNRSLGTWVALASDLDDAYMWQDGVILFKFLCPNSAWFALFETTLSYQHLQNFIFLSFLHDMWHRFAAWTSLMNALASSCLDHSNWIILYFCFFPNMDDRTHPFTITCFWLTSLVSLNCS